MNPRIAVITGASRGLGRSIAVHLAARGVNIVGTYRQAQAEAEEVAREIVAAGSRAAMVRLDVGTKANIDAFAATLPALLEREFGVSSFDYLVNNAGLGHHVPFAQTSEAQFDELISVQLKAPFYLTQALLPVLTAGGKIVNLSSGLARFTLPGYAAYAAAKGGIEVLTRYMAKELGERGITVNVVAPGAIETDFGGGAVRDNAQLNAAIASTIPLGRVGKPDDVGAAVAALLLDAGGWINGARVEVSGGQNL